MHATITLLSDILYHTQLGSPDFVRMSVWGNLVLTFPLFVFLGAPAPPLSPNGIVAPVQSAPSGASKPAGIDAVWDPPAAAPRPAMALIPPLRGSENLDKKITFCRLKLWRSRSRILLGSCSGPNTNLLWNHGVGFEPQCKIWFLCRNLISSLYWTYRPTVEKTY